MKALFLDRDGVVNEDTGYAHDPSSLILVEGIIELITFFQKKSFLILVVSNQSGIGREIYGEEDWLRFNSAINSELIKRGCKIDRFYFCPHLPYSETKKRCNCRKPATGMLDKARSEFKIDYNKSILVGDRETDILAAYNAGLSRAYFFCKSPTTEIQLSNFNVQKVSNLKEIIKIENDI